MSEEVFYYKGTLVSVKNEIYSSSKKIAKSDGYTLNSFEFFSYLENQLGFFSLSVDERVNLKRWLCDFEDIDKKLLGESLSKVFGYDEVPYKKIDGISIYFQKVVDENGDEYAKEVKTGLLFPIYNPSNTNGTWFKTTKQPFDRVTYYINYKYQMANSSIDCIQSMVSSYKVVNKSEVDKYLGLSTTFSDTYVKQLYVENKFNKEVNIGESKKTLSEEEIMIYMESIELALFKLEKINPEISSLFRHYYDYLSNGNSNTDLLTEENLKEFRNQLKLALSNVKDNSTIYDHLDAFINKYVESIKYSEEIDSLDWFLALNDIIIKNKDNISHQEKRKLYLRLSLLYFLDLYKNERDIDSVKGTYVESNYKTILLNLMMLEEEGYIETKIDYDEDYSFEELFKLMDSITFSKFDDEVTLKLFK